ncbi:YafY family protein [Cocleimonas sp. KMM 6892]|jgi:predicted DNA-binding transcriptional regulator YafY|uniref:helix-turn-helix transcriptional regulator n=1 Tax=unclassified Cocleimonas TaxID=2639732 RepID=UPI002DB8465C|nr:MULTISPECIES: YafY family protein [unclassified Cocleimonas]MEB8431254.1 YafY family protein [Cocleimonas sp. KMM 6892]MEC4713974.1 YafY family protein [Cocleimonas sp. KMM 6895]MEC4743305.1 YafY family protein [Cocleimonas sp. KMM 6896]
MRRADRLFQIVQFLRTRRVTTAAWLAERLEVSERTIYRDIKDLMLSGVNIEGEAGIGYVVRRGFDLPPLMFTKEEISALTLGARLVDSWADPELATAAQSVLSKIETVLPADLKSSLDETKMFSPYMRIHPKVASMMTQVRKAADNRFKLNMQYTRADGKASERTIWPLGLFFWGSIWTIGAWCELRQEFRVFRLDRIQVLRVLTDSYPHEKGKTLEDMIEHEKKQYCS